MIKKIIAALLLVPALVFAAGDHVKLDQAPINAGDTASLQRGAKLFVNYCLNCHSANYMRYNRLVDIGLNEKEILENLVFSGGKVGDLMKNAMDPNEAKVWFGAPPPDLTVIARARASGDGSGADWLYTYLRTFYRDPARPTGWNNTTYPNVGMPHVLWELQGEQEMKADKVRADGYMAAVEKPVLAKPGKLSVLEYDSAVADLVNYMVYMGEPAAKNRKNIGLVVLAFLLGLIFLVYALKKEFWKDVH
ncbi:MAG TPA: cytochrome c1 [Burkholderiales bacterium]|nr:cytochrome c1 [Burkholderiales bacterium]